MSRTADIFRQFRQRLMIYIRRQVADASDAEDILQDVFLRLTLQDNAIQIEDYAAWLFRTVRNRIIDLRRKNREERFKDGLTIQEDAGSDETPEEKLFDTMVWERIEEALAELLNEQRKAFVETEINGKSNQQLSEETGVPVATLISRKHYAKQYLRNRLRDLYDDLLQ